MYEKYECSVMHMLYVCVLCASCGSSQCCIMCDLQGCCIVLPGYVVKVYPDPDTSLK